MNEEQRKAFNLKKKLQRHARQALETPEQKQARLLKAKERNDIWRAAHPDYDKQPWRVTAREASTKLWKTAPETRNIYLQMRRNWRDNNPRKLYQAIYDGMIQRCTNPKNPAFPRYGGAGITMCDWWLESIDNFIMDMAPRPSKDYSIDRIDGTKGYYKENCRWATDEEQANNDRRNVQLTYNGKTQNVSQWARELGFSPKTLYMRLDRGWSNEETLTTPVNQTYSRNAKGFSND